MRKICNSLLGIYKHSNDVELTVCSVKALKALCNNANAFKGIAQDYYVILQDWTVDQFKKIISVQQIVICLPKSCFNYFYRSCQPEKKKPQ